WRRGCAGPHSRELFLRQAPSPASVRTGKSPRGSWLAFWGGRFAQASSGAWRRVAVGGSSDGLASDPGALTAAAATPAPHPAAAAATAAAAPAPSDAATTSLH